MERLTRAIAIDFDGCLCENKWPEIGEPHWDVIHAAIREQVGGASLILWTCRHGYLLSEAIDACENWGLTFDAVNENLPERLEYYGSESRKISADEYWDDHAVHMPEPPNNPLTLEELREMDGEPVWVTPTKESKNWWIPSTVYWRRPKMDTGWWMLVNAEEEKCFESHWASAYFSDYGKNWLAYRRKPEEGTM